jgi:hypothetical protein
MRGGQCRYDFFYQVGAMGSQQYGWYLADVAPDLVRRFGRGYIGDCIAGRYNRDRRRELCFEYIGECLRGIVKTSVSLPELLETYRNTKPRDNRTTQEVAADIVAGLSSILGEE